ncbi:hypothetical protein ACFL20_01370, partial [Spirochaetota bacterium]
FFPIRVYTKQDLVPKGKIGIFVTSLILPEKMEDRFFINIFNKIATHIIPWPFRVFAKQDKGLALLDPVRHYEFKKFKPTALVDQWGKTKAPDGESYMEKYRKGMVKWAPPTRMIHRSNGYFIYTGAKGGMPSLSGKLINKARVWYYGVGIKQKKIPHWKGSFDVINKAMKRIKKAYPGIQWQAESSMYYKSMKKKLFKLLDGGSETIILASPMAVYSHFEEFDSSFRHCFEYIHEWEKKHPGKKIKIIMAPPMGNYKSLREAYLAMLKDRLNTLPKKASVAVAVATHGTPKDQRPWEAWIKMAPAYVNPLLKEVKGLLGSYSFSKKLVLSCQDEFASHVRDPKNKWLSTREAYGICIKEGYDYVINLPIEFFSENTDSMFYHALKNYEGFDKYDRYAPFDYPDWNKPFVVKYRQGKTNVIYNGTPVGKYQHYVVDAFYNAVNSIVSRKKQ